MYDDCRGSAVDEHSIGSAVDYLCMRRTVYVLYRARIVGDLSRNR